MFDDMDDGFDDQINPAVMAGTAYALYRHGQDRQTQQIIDALAGQQPAPVEVEVTVAEDEPPPVNIRVVEPVESDWDEYFGQEPLKRQLTVYMDAAKARNDTMPHTLLASGFPGVGKTYAARLIAKTLGVPMVELMPPFDVYTLVEAALRLPPRGVLFVDEIHKLADSGKRGAEILLKVLEEGVAFLPDGSQVALPDITIIGATTDRDKLPEPVLDRFKIKPYFQAYSNVELTCIAVLFAFKNQAEDVVDDVMAWTMALACRGTPRVLEEFVLAQRDLSLSLGSPATPEELLAFLEVEADGLTRTHVHYLTAVYQYFARTNSEGEVEYIVGEAAIKQILRETANGIQRVEGFLVERGLIDRTPRGRRLTPAGIERAQEFIKAGKGASDV